MTDHKREISKEVYDRATQNGGVITEQDKERLFSSADLYGYGVYGAHAYMDGDKYMMSYSMGDSCD